MTEKKMESVLKELLEDENEGSDLHENIRDVRTFEDDGVLTRNRGLVLRMDDGSEYQITIVKSRNARNEEQELDEEEED